MSLESRYKKIVKIVAILAVLLILVSIAVALFVNIKSKENESASSQAYEAARKYSAIIESSEESDEAVIKAALDDLAAAEFEFSSDSFYFSQMNFFQANLHKKSGNIEMENACLEDIVFNATKDNYLLPIAIYRLAVNSEEAGDVQRALEFYSMFLNEYSDTHPYSQMVIFSLFRINYGLSNTEEAKKYSALLSEKYPQSTLTNFVTSLL